MPRILVVDDRDDNLYLMQMMLKAKDFTVMSASNGQEALESALRNPPDIIITDILMPVMDGFNLCRRWRADERLRSIPFIFYTATYTDARDEQFALGLGADRFLVKPLAPDVLVRNITEVLESPRTADRTPPLPVPQDEVVYLQEYNQTLVRKLELKVEQLEEANKALAVKESAIASAISAIMLLDLAGRITYVNSSCVSLWGYRSDELIGKSAAILLADPATAAQALQTVEREGQWVGEAEARRSDGTVFTAQVVVHRVTDQHGAAVCYMASCIDVTGQKRVREDVQRSHRMESLSLFAAGIAHDYNNLLTGLFVGLELIQNDLPVHGAAREQFNVIMSVFTRARDLTQRLLAFAKGGTPVQRKLAVPDVVRESCSLSLSGTGIRHELTVEKDTWLVMADASQLSQVFNNILINARQAMGDQGLLSITIGKRSLTEESVRPLPAGDYVSIQFTDSGPGIPEDIVGRIFDPYFTTKKQGSGLGLATSYAIVKNHGGCITAASRTEGGAVFTVWLPASGERRMEAPKAPAPDATRGEGRILLVDDEEAIRKLARQILVKAGYEVAIAANGEEALALYRQAESSRQPFNLAILDLTIRGGMGGEETLAALRALTPHVAAIASTGYTDGGMVSQLKEHGFLGLLPKPYRAHELLSTVKAVMRKENASL